MKMIESRVKTAHTYNEDTADEIAANVIGTYFSLFTDLHSTMEQIINEEERLS
jgi:hypothetical protein